MKLTIDRDVLLTGLNAAKAAVMPRAVIPVLACVRIEARDGEIELTATDQEVRIQRTLPAVVNKPGIVAVDCGRFLQTISLADAGELTIDLNEEMLEVRQLFNEQQLPTVNPDTFPTWNAGETEGFEVNAATLAKAFRSTSFINKRAAETREGMRFAINDNVLFSCREDGFEMVSTDSKRMAMVSWKGTGPKRKTDGLIPLKAIQTILPLLTGDGNVTVAIAPTEAKFSGDGWMVATRLMEGRYPPYKDIVPKKSKHEIALNPGIFLSKVRQAANMTDQETCRIDCHFAEGKLRITAAGAKLGRAAAEMPIPVGDVTLSLSVDPDYLVDFLRVVDAESVTMLLTEPEKPILFQAGEGYLYLVMPLAG